MKNRVFYIDGSCDNNRDRVGGVGIVEVVDGEIVSMRSFGPYKDVTSARMEVMGLFLVLRELYQCSERVTIYCDNQYVCKSINNSWASQWVYDFRKFGDERKHIDLWEDICENISKLKRISTTINLVWVRGHNGNKYNELADRCANIGRKTPFL